MAKYTYRVTKQVANGKGTYEASSHVVAGNKRGAETAARDHHPAGKVIKIERLTKVS